MEATTPLSRSPSPTQRGLSQNLVHCRSRHNERRQRSPSLPRINLSSSHPPSHSPSPTHEEDNRCVRTLRRHNTVQGFGTENFGSTADAPILCGSSPAHGSTRRSLNVSRQLRPGIKNITQRPYRFMNIIKK